MNTRIFALTLGLGLAASGTALADDCGAPPTVDYCKGAAACGVMYVPYYDAVWGTPLLQNVTVQGPETVSLELPQISPTSPKSQCVAYFVPPGNYNVEATFADGKVARSSVAVPQLRTRPTCPQVGIDLRHREIKVDPILCRGLIQGAS